MVVGVWIIDDKRFISFYCPLAQRQLLCCYFSENDFWDDGAEITGNFLFSSKVQWGDNYTLHEDPEYFLRS